LRNHFGSCHLSMTKTTRLIKNVLRSKVSLDERRGPFDISTRETCPSYVSPKCDMVQLALFIIHYL
jgi:hypothetical protein